MKKETRKLRKKWNVLLFIMFVSVLVLISIITVKTGTKAAHIKGIQSITKNINEVAFGNAYVEENDNDNEKSQPIVKKSTEKRERKISSTVTEYDGKERSISCWGDSMMYGCSTTSGFIERKNTTYNISLSTTPSTIQRLTGIKTYNLGVNGDTSYDIAIRAGGIKMYTDRDINIEGTGTAEIQLRTDNGYFAYMEDYSGYNFTSNDINICVIDNQKYYICNSLYGESQVIYGTDVHIPAGTPVYTLASQERKDDILILEMGSNSGWDSYEDLIYEYDSILETTDCKYYIIVGDTDDPDLSADENKAYVGNGETPWEHALSEAYGDHFINMRLYLIQNGLKDCGLDQTDEDTAGYEEGKISSQLRSDWTHFNSYGYYSKAKGIFEKGVQLGYWSDKKPQN